MKIVTPFKPFAPESVSHTQMADFDWPGAIKMLRASAREASGHRVTVLTDLKHFDSFGNDVFGACTHHTRLMLWLNEVVLKFLDSDAFDQDTVMLSPDMLVFEDLSRFFRADLGIVARLQPKYVQAGRPLLWGLQFWRYAAKDRLVALYREALSIAEGLPENAQQWGADIEPFYTLLAPTSYGIARREGLKVDFIAEREVMASITGHDMVLLEDGRLPITEAPVVDFRYTRKLYMRKYFDATVGKAVPA